MANPRVKNSAATGTPSNQGVTSAGTLGERTVSSDQGAVNALALVKAPTDAAGLPAKTLRLIKALESVPLGSVATEILRHEGQTDGMGYTVEHVRPGRGFSMTEYARKVLENERSVLRRTYYPSPFDSQMELTERFSVWVGWETENEEYEDQFFAPPGISLPPGAEAWSDTAFEGPRHWFADFLDQEEAETFAASQSRVCEGTDIPPLVRTEA